MFVLGIVLNLARVWFLDYMGDTMKTTHVYDICFEVTTDECEPYEVSKELLLAALKARVESIELSNDIDESVGYCDSYDPL